MGGKKRSSKRAPVEDGFLKALKALDNQVARELQRSPAEREIHRLQRWEPYERRVEQVSILLLDLLGEEQVQLDSLFITAQAMTKALQIVAHDLGEEGLGKMRTGYCIDTMEKISTDAHRTLALLRDTHNLV